MEISNPASLTIIDSKMVQASSPKQAAPSGNLKETCSELESLFIYYLMKEMRESIPDSGLFGNRETEKLYTSMLDEEMSRQISSKREIGISSMLYNQFVSPSKASEDEK